MRDSYDRYFMNIAKVVATRATCDRKHVGAVIVGLDRSILSTGYNGSMRFAAHCDDVGHLMEDGHCIRTVHAEANAIAQAARHGVQIAGSTIYTTASPCFQCFKLIVNSGIREVIYGELYRDPGVAQHAREQDFCFRCIEDLEPSKEVAANKGAPASGVVDTEEPGADVPFTGELPRGC